MGLKDDIISLEIIERNAKIERELLLKKHIEKCKKLSNDGGN